MPPNHDGEYDRHDRNEVFRSDEKPPSATMSARAPAGRANKNIGRLAATCTSETIKGSGSTVVISHAAAALYIQEPILEMTVAAQITAKALLRKGFHREGAGASAEAAFTMSPLVVSAAHRMHQRPILGQAVAQVQSRKAQSLPHVH
jgi:hypothetical protein